VRAVRFTKAETAQLLALLQTVSDCEANIKVRKLYESILTKLESAALSVKSVGLPVGQAIAAFAEALGSRLIAPPSGAGIIYAQMSRRIAALGLTRGQCLEIAKEAGHRWVGAIKAESIVRQAEVLMSAEVQSPGRSTPKQPVEMDDL
jgi:hypothetical protein